MSRKFIPLAALALGTLLQTSPIPLRAWELGPAGLIPVAIPTGVEAIVLTVQADLDGDGAPERLSATDGHVIISSGDEPVWQSPDTWQVTQAEITDLNHDSAPEVTLLVWRPFRPWPVDKWLPHGGRIANFHDAEGNSSHIILIGWREGQYRELWAGSALAEPVRSFTTAEMDGDLSQELVTLEGRYTDSRSTPAHAVKVWEWNGFGFTVVSTIEGTFDKISIVQTNDGRTLILAP